MRGVEVEISCGSYLGDIVTKLVKIWTCVFVFVMIEGVVDRK